MKNKGRKDERKYERIKKGRRGGRQE